MDLSYDAQNQLNTAKVSKNKITQTYHYTYDPFGRRVTKTDTFGTTYFTWDGNRLLTESRGDTDQSYIYEQFGFTPIASTNKQNELHYYHSDHLGTPQEVTNNQGEIVWEAEYATWGNTTKVTYKQIDANIQEEIEFQPLRFQGQYYDAETGLHYNRFRYYDPDIGRFISQDPIGLLGGTNLYQYAPNPVGWVDELGLVGRKAARRAVDSEIQKELRKGRKPKVVTAIIDKKTGKSYTGTSNQGKPRENLSVRTKKRFKGHESEYSYDNDNCAEIGAYDKAVKAGVKDEDMIIHTKMNRNKGKTPNYQDVDKCKNCQHSNGDIKTTSECSI